MTVYKTRFFLILFLCFAVVSCKALGEVRPTTERPETEDLIALLKNRSQIIQTVQADGKIEYKKKGKDGRHDRGSFTWVIEKPANATFEITGPTGLLAVVGINEEEFRYFDARGQKLYFGPVEPETLGRVLPWGIMPADLVPLLCASPKLINYNGSAIEFDKSTKRWRLILHDSRTDKIQVFWFNDDKTVYKSKLIRRKHVFWEVTYLDWDKRGEYQIEFPAYIKLEHPSSRTTITLRAHGDMDLNKKIDDSVFKLNFPDTIPVERM